MSILIAYVAFPALLYYFPSIIGSIVFARRIKQPFINYEDLKKNGIKSAGRNLYLMRDDDDEQFLIGIW